MPNAFESGERKAIPAVLVYVREGARVLMVQRNAPDRPGDYHAGKWNGLGGKLEPDESPFEAARREVREEAGLDLPEASFRMLGVLQFPNFKAHKSEDWVCFVLSAEVEPALAATAWKSGPEGDLHWVDQSRLLELNLWAGDRHFIPYVSRGEPFFGTLWYHGQDVVRHEVSGWVGNPR